MAFLDIYVYKFTLISIKILETNKPMVTDKYEMKSLARFGVGESEFGSLGTSCPDANECYSEVSAQRTI